MINSSILEHETLEPFFFCASMPGKGKSITFDRSDSNLVNKHNKWQKILFSVFSVIAFLEWRLYMMPPKKTKSSEKKVEPKKQTFLKKKLLLEDPDPFFG